MARAKEGPGTRNPGHAHNARGHQHDTATSRERQVAEQFLRDLFGEAAAGWLVLWTMPGRASKWYEVPGQLQRAAADAVKRASAHDVFFGVGLQAQRVKRGRGTADTVCFIPAVWADIDVAGEGHSKGKTYFPSKDAARAFLDSLPVKPTIIVDSGHGLHGYWILRDPLVLASPEDRAHAVKVLTGWQSSIQAKAKALGYDVDATADPARVLRVPGTVNHKGDPLPVVVLAADGPAVNASELLEYAPAASVPAPVQPSAAGEIVFDPNAEPPAMKLVALLDNDKKFRKTWDRKRPDLKDQSASAYDLALADITVAAGWSDQEICNLLVAFRRKHGEDLKRLDYFVTTIKKARATAQPTADAVAAIEDATGTDDRAGKLAKLREVFHLPLARVVVRTLANEDPQFALLLDGGEEITVGGADDLLSQRHVRALVAGRAGRVMPHLKQQQWEMLAQLLLDIREVEQLPEELSEHGEMRVALRHYLDRATLLREGPDGEHPFWGEDGRLYFVGSHFREWLKLRRLGDLSGKKFGRVMALLRITGEHVTMTVKRSVTSRSCWRLPLDLTPERREP